MTSRILQPRGLWAAVVALATVSGVAATLARNPADAPPADHVRHEELAAVAQRILHGDRSDQRSGDSADQTSARDLSKAFRSAAEQVLPALVTIESRPEPVQLSDNRSRDRRRQDPFGGRNPFEGTPFEDMFRDFPFDDGFEGFRFESPRPYPRSGSGSGVVIDPSGVILTNDHVVEGGKLTVKLSDGREFSAAQVWTDPKTDIAVIKIDGADNLTAARLGNSDQVQVGDWVLALGQPFGLESTVTAGIISAKHRALAIADRENFLQTDAAINPGNSGGPLVNLDGEVIGINTAISSRSGGNDGIGFAIPINLAKWVSAQLLTRGNVRRAYLGVSIQPITAALAEKFDVQPRKGVIVTDVFPDSPADQAGVKSGDVIVEFDGHAVNSPQELQVLVEQAELGQSKALVVMRQGERVTLSFTPQEMPNDFGRGRGRSIDKGPGNDSAPLDRLGLEIATLDDQVARQLGMEGIEGVVITSVAPGSVAELAGLSPGMVIVQIQRQPVTNVDEAVKLLESADAESGILLLIRTAEGSRFVVLQP